MTQRPVIVVEDDPFMRLVGVVLDPRTTGDRHAAFAHFFAHDLPDFAGWAAELRRKAGALYPAEVRLASSREAFHAALPGARAAIVESFGLGREELALGRSLEVVQKFGTITRDIDAVSCAERNVKVLTLRRCANIACAEHALALMLALAKKLNQLAGLISIGKLTQEEFSPAAFDRKHTAGIRRAALACRIRPARCIARRKRLDMPAAAGRSRDSRLDRSHAACAG